MKAKAKVVLKSKNVIKVGWKKMGMKVDWRKEGELSGGWRNGTEVKVGQRKKAALKAT